jgi:hypothetical protein
MIVVIMDIEDVLDREVEVDQDQDLIESAIVNLDHVVVVVIDVIEQKVDRDLEQLEEIVNVIHMIENVQVQKIVRDHQKRENQNQRMIQNVKHQKNVMMLK